MEEYPDDLLRGLSQDDWVNDGIVTAAAFQINFEPQFLKNDCHAHSICWEDDSSVIDLIMQQKKEGRFKFKMGIARFPREDIDRLMKQPAFKGILSYERDSLGPENPHHGNLLVSPNISKTQRKLLPGAIAHQFSDIIPRA